MCEHRIAERWSRMWEVFLLVVLGGFAVLEGASMATGRPTLSIYLRRLAGLQTGHCRHSRYGRLGIVAFLSWATLHLGWGLLGVGPKRRVRR